ncbi:spore germination protein [Alteribacillus persepolensis]|uniref:Spore germination protein n=1 Tax=Alteribacillus persepolensis TaxID=568899 RepID=A0A1G8GXN4_9BACI|nr:LysM peptidoglycan-binding domain-containing protein [Alteribacillus persepolensis]SDH99031.1 spore germination protein [Alteribacillus persepolensis]
MQIHVVAPGDTLWTVSQRYRSDIHQIILVNQLTNPDVLAAGQALVIPEPGREYVVQSGDTLWNISQRFGISVSALASVNQIMNPALIYAGQMLVLPFFPHVVQPGESLWVLSRRYGVSAEEIMQANQIPNPSMIFIGQTLYIPRRSRPVKDIMAYITNLGEAGRREVLEVGRNLTYLAPFSYSIKEDGSLTALQDEAVLQAARANNASSLLVVTNLYEGSFNSDRIAAILRGTNLQETLITNILQLMQAKGYTGVHFDLEYIYPEDRENYNQFLRRVVSRLRPQGYSVSTALAPKDSAEQTGLLYEAHDYRAHGEIVDFVVLMTYEWGWAGGRPLAIAPIHEVKEVLDYAVTVIPREKILMGIPLYGRDWRIPWVEGTFARTVSPQEAVQLAQQYGASIQYDETYQSPYFRYRDETGQEHEVWFEDARSIQAKYKTIEEYGLRGGSFWVLGVPFPQSWPVLRGQFTVRKR